MRMIKKKMKEMRIVVSMLLVMALVITGADWSGVTARAEGAEPGTIELLNWEGLLTVRSSAGADGSEASGYVGIADTACCVTSGAGAEAVHTWASEQGGCSVTYKLDLAKYDWVSVEVYGTADKDTTVWVRQNVYDDTATKPSEETPLEVKEGKFAAARVYKPAVGAYTSVALDEARADIIEVTKIVITGYYNMPEKPEITTEPVSPVKTVGPAEEPTGTPKDPVEETDLLTWEGSMSVGYDEEKEKPYNAEMITNAWSAASPSAFGSWASGEQEGWGVADLFYSEDLSVYDRVRVEVYGIAKATSKVNVELSSGNPNENNEIRFIPVYEGEFAQAYTYKPEKKHSITVGLNSNQVNIVEVTKVVIKGYRNVAEDSDTTFDAIVEPILPTESPVASLPAITTEPTETVEPTVAPAEPSEEPTVHPAEPSEEPTVQPTEEPTVKPTRTPEPTPTGDANGFAVSLSHVTSSSWYDSAWGEPSIYVDRDGEYSLSYQTSEDSDHLNLLMLDTNLYSCNVSDRFKMEGVSIQIGDQTYDASNADFCFANSATAEDAKKHPYRLNFINPWSYPTEDDGYTKIEGVNSVDVLDGEDVDIREGDQITVTFRVSGLEARTAEPVKTKQPTKEPTKTIKPVRTEAPTEAPTGTPYVEPEPTPTGNAKKFTATLSYVTDDSWEDQNLGDYSVDVTKDGEYSISYKAALDTDDLYLLLIDTNLYKMNAPIDLKMEGVSIKIGNKTYDASGADFCYRDSVTEEEAEKQTCRLNFINPWCVPTEDDGYTLIKDADPMDVLKDQKVSIHEGDKITVTFRVSGMDSPVPGETTEPDVSNQPNHTDAAPVNTPNSTPNNNPVVPTQAPVTYPTIAPQSTQKPQTTADVDQDDSDDEDDDDALDIEVGRAAIASVKAQKGKKIKVSLKKVEDADGYQILYSTSSKMKNSKKITTTKSTATISKLKKGRRYYIKARAYIKADGDKIYGEYSKIKTVKVKK